MTGTKKNYITVLWEARAKKGMEAQMKSFITGVITGSRNDPGCIDYEAHEVEGQRGIFIILEKWESKAALEGHLNCDRMKEKAPQLLEMMEGSIEDGIRLLQSFRPEQ
ncbi:antibiotic biosynthesis monooxygenase [Sinomicrobium kalidii]|uniref:putative quinol monooxygenase n=1 Tax=Sinomicrobium kalidii TaxID=2900738 RepID=UPI001E2A5B08|nr:putative quinol monooxygenase [Sinomicrobium kalidii]UGU15469.1 antibiotic biosynthesis monooxygenase [Sinomicrobium kalidii]